MSSRYKIDGDLARPWQLFMFTSPDDLETQIASETILWPAILKREFTVSYTSKIKMGCTRTSERQARD